MRIFCDPLGDFVDVPHSPQRIVSLVSSATEIIAAVGHISRVAGVSSYCPRYVDGLSAPIVGDYLRVDEALLRSIQPDLVLTTTGVQRGLARKLHAGGYPVYVLPLPNSIWSILDGVLLIGGLLDALPEAQRLADRWGEWFSRMVCSAPQPPPRVYAELWFGRHVRMPGGLTFVSDLIRAAGGTPLFCDVPAAYLPLDLNAVDARAPAVALFFSEPEYPVDGLSLAQERGWLKRWPHLRVIQSTVERGRNLIHDGPSFMDTAEWLRMQIQAG
ncbi:MAG: ABC transporter substrate-binding protein [Chthonomonadales bacterium]